MAANGFGFSVHIAANESRFCIPVALVSSADSVTSFLMHRSEKTSRTE
jgi:hypothetical protein